MAHDLTRNRVVSPTLVGRSEELDILVSAISDPPVVAVVQGEAGIGKTRLVSELATRPELAGRRVVVGRCRRIREPFPLGPLLEIVGRLGPYLEGGTAVAGGGSIATFATGDR